MNYPNIKQAKLSHRQIAKAFGYKNVNAFRCSSAHKRHMQGVENILILVVENRISLRDLMNKELEKKGIKFVEPPDFSKGFASMALDALEKQLFKDRFRLQAKRTFSG